jgi:hypothetical protein
MNPWRWVRSRRWWVQLILAAVLLPVVLLLAYVGVRTLQFFSAEHDAGVYVPAGANVVFRLRGLEAHLKRIRTTTAWRAFDRRVLHDAVLRRQINGVLKENGAPTLDDLDDERKPFAKHQERVLDVMGDDVIASLRVRESVAKAPFCAIVRLRWLYFLGTPFAGLALPTESIDGHSVLVLGQGAQQVRVALVGALAIVSNDKALLQEALARRGREEESERPVAGRVVFEGSPGLLAVRRSIRDSGLMATVNWETARGLSFSADLRDAMALTDVQIDRAEPLHPGAPPTELRAWAPLSTSGLLLTNTGGADLISWMAGLTEGTAAQDVAAQAVKDALKALDDGGLHSTLLPQLKEGMAVVTGVEEREGRSYTSFVLLLPARDPAAAVEAMNGIVRKIAGSYADSKYFAPMKVGDVTLNSWSWPEGLQINDLLSPTYGAVKGVLVLGNNPAFTTQVVETVAGGGGFEETSEYRKLRKRMKEEGFGEDPSLAGGFIFPPLLRASLDGTLPHLAKQIVYAYEKTHAAQIRAEVETELRRQGNASEAEIGKAYFEAIKRMKEEEEAALRRNLEPLNAVHWAAFEAQSGDRGIRVRAALEFQ